MCERVSGEAVSTAGASCSCDDRSGLFALVGAEVPGCMRDGIVREGGD